MSQKLSKDKEKQQIIEDYLLGIILSGQVKPGEYLKTQREISEAFQISRPVVSKAIGKVESMGLLTSKPRHGILVNDYTHCGKLSLLEQIIDMEKELIDPNLRANLIDFLGGNLYLMLKEILIKGSLKPITAEQEHIGDFDFWTWLKRISIATENKIYPLLLNEFEIGIKNVSKYIHHSKQERQVYDLCNRIEEQIIRGRLAGIELLLTELQELLTSVWRGRLDE